MHYAQYDRDGRTHFFMDGTVDHSYCQITWNAAFWPRSEVLDDPSIYSDACIYCIYAIKYRHD
jgi:hypothetical protein